MHSDSDAVCAKDPPVSTDTLKEMAHKIAASIKRREVK